MATDSGQSNLWYAGEENDWVLEYVNSVYVISSSGRR